MEQLGCASPSPQPLLCGDGVQRLEDTLRLKHFPPPPATLHSWQENPGSSWAAGWSKVGGSQTHTASCKSALLLISWMGWREMLGGPDLALGPGFCPPLWYSLIFLRRMFCSHWVKLILGQKTCTDESTPTQGLLHTQISPTTPNCIQAPLLYSQPCY